MLSAWSWYGKKKHDLVLLIDMELEKLVISIEDSIWCIPNAWYGILYTLTKVSQFTKSKVLLRSNLFLFLVLPAASPNFKLCENFHNLALLDYRKWLTVSLFLNLFFHVNNFANFSKLKNKRNTTRQSSSGCLLQQNFDQ